MEEQDPTKVAAPFALTPLERDVFGLLLRVDAELELGQRYRVAGGWVRDKLLGLESDDIDIALDGMSGAAFVERLRAFGKERSERGIGRSYVVGQNVEKSKHLETATIDLFGNKVEFVHLRSESYADGSRVPEIRVGTAREDAERRDLTINALFFDVAAGEVEDHVGGLADLKSMVLRTPAAPEQTFLDDPLRVLRVLRFWSRYADSSLDAATREGMRSEHLRDAYARKVSPERSGVELVKLLAGASPARALAVLHEAELVPVVRGERAAGELQEDDEAPRLVDAFRTGGSAGWHGRAAAWCAGSANRDDLESRGTLAVRCLKRISIGKTDREAVGALVRGVALGEADDWDGPAMARLVRLVPEAWGDALLIAGARRGDAQWATDRARGVRVFLSREPALEPLIDGDDVMRLLPDLDPRTGFIRVVTERLLDAQAAFEVIDRAGAEAYDRGMASDLEHPGDG